MSEAMSAIALAAEVRSGRASAVSAVTNALAAIRAGNGRINAVTRLLDARALARAADLDARIAAGGDPGPLAGVPFGAKDLFDVAGLPTTAGARMLQDAPPATADAQAIARMEAAGAILVATCNMDEFAYGFVTDNAFHGPTRNPHDPARFAGGSSGGSAAAVAAGMMPLSLGSDTNGSIRVPAALCGLYGLKPTHGGLPMAGVYPFVDSFDDIGPFARTLADLKLAYEVLNGAPLPAPSGSAPRAARLSGWFAANVGAELSAAIDGLGLETVEVEGVRTARSAAYIMTACEGGHRHLPALRTRAMAFDPATRDRLIAGAMTPAAAYQDALAWRTRFAARFAAVFDRYDVLVAPCVGDVAPRIDDPTIAMDGARVPARAHLGLFTQPLSFIGLPVIAVPLRRAGLPLGLQIVGKPGGEAALFEFSQRLEEKLLIGAT